MLFRGVPSPFSVRFYLTGSGNGCEASDVIQMSLADYRLQIIDWRIRKGNGDFDMGVVVDIVHGDFMRTKVH
ncbi:hypothetical protein CEXT_295121 [Caerostris extrusa]|uniref:Uncharacterized protein n=1 Tax=Caerostris extrusa TaxID=172846 RepID=A0AAV4XGS0_CAEEX|nr:hypothetical protein CEXT_295121 [Caerostris extrusa]